MAIRYGVLLGVVLELQAIGAAAAPTAPPEISIPGDRVFPESLTSTRQRQVIIGSIGEHAIFRTQPGDSAAAVWIPAGTAGIQGIFGVLADEASHTLWACSNVVEPPGAPGLPPAELYAFDLDTGSAKAHYAFQAAGSFCNDITVSPDGSVYVTDTNNMEIEWLQKGAGPLRSWAGSHGEFGPKGGALDGIALSGQRIFVNTYLTGKIYAVEVDRAGRAGMIRPVTVNRPLERPDGMRAVGHDVLLVVEGGAGRLSRLTIKGNSAAATTIKEGYTDGPVAVTTVGSVAYVLEGQLAALMGPPSSQPPHVRPFRATAVPLE